MICPGSNVDCDNPGCRHGGCQGRLPQLPLFQAIQRVDAAAPAEKPAVLIPPPVRARLEPLAA